MDDVKSGIPIALSHKRCYTGLVKVFINKESLVKRCFNSLFETITVRNDFNHSVKTY